jgi:enoyl-CoA hydratase/carnithine racemase
LQTPIIAALNGAAIGVGLTLPLWDIRIVAEDAKYGLPFTRRAVIRELNATWLPRMIGAAKALEIMLTGRLFLGSEAKTLGIAHEAVPAGQVLERVMAIAENIAVNTSPAALSAVKSLVNIGLAEDHRYISWARELEVFAKLAEEPGALEAARAFMEKRSPNWTGAKQGDVPVTPARALPGMS